MRRSIDCVLLVHQHGHPHVLLLQIGNNQKGFFKLYNLFSFLTLYRPGGRCRPGESEADCIKRKLTKRLAPQQKEFQPDWQIGECISIWYRPNFETLFVRFYSTVSLLVSLYTSTYH